MATILVLAITKVVKKLYLTLMGLPKNKLFQEKQETGFLKNDNHLKGGTGIKVPPWGATALGGEPLLLHVSWI
ncbi:MAG: hypothetical protein V7L04_27970 [Nostoc sp.]|uniref:hypothetical protein n=1 Tax=unclassified Nostoc TaxID=2593658 RepID=UPI00261F6622|nr:hypothetical protein [Nostoc sp. S13]MDF5739115.1 hypothetical protein [Nostoc sp. S13]